MLVVVCIISLISMRKLPALLKDTISFCYFQYMVKGKIPTGIKCKTKYIRTSDDFTPYYLLSD